MKHVREFFQPSACLVAQCVGCGNVPEREAEREWKRWKVTRRGNAPETNAGAVVKQQNKKAFIQSRQTREAGAAVQERRSCLVSPARLVLVGASARSHFVSESCHRSSCGLRKSVSMRRGFFTATICFDPRWKVRAYRERVVA